MSIAKEGYLNAPSYNYVLKYIIQYLPSLNYAELKVLMVIFRCTLFARQSSLSMSLSNLEQVTGLTKKSIISGVKRLEDEKWILVDRTVSPFRYSMNMRFILAATDLQTISGALIENVINYHSYDDEVHLLRLGIPYEHQRVFRMWNFYCSPALNLNSANHQKCVQALIFEDSYKKIYQKIIEIIQSREILHHHSDAELLEIFGVNEQQ